MLVEFDPLLLIFVVPRIVVAPVIFVVPFTATVDPVILVVPVPLPILVVPVPVPMLVELDPVLLIFVAPVIVVAPVTATVTPALPILIFVIGVKGEVVIVVPIFIVPAFGPSLLSKKLIKFRLESTFITVLVPTGSLFKPCPNLNGVSKTVHNTAFVTGFVPIKTGDVFEPSEQTNL